MLKHVLQIGGRLALSVVWSLALGAATAQPVPVWGEQGVIMVKQQAPVWLQCRFEADQTPEVPGFCARLRADFVRQSGRVIGPEAVAPEGAQVLVVTVAPRDAHRAMVTLAVGRQLDGQFVVSSTQQMRLGSVDAPLQASSAAALIYPLVSLLETLR
ncbi:MAG: hypothetical protein V4586_06965 [Pseudomonadota bacterium]